MDDEALAREFEEHRPHLRAVAHRMLGSLSEADDAVQEAWLRLHRSDVGGIDNLGGWLTTVVSRVCLDALRSRTSRREEPWETLDRDPVSDEGTGPEHEALLADSVGPALLVVLDTLAPAERLSFVLHDMFAVPFDEIAAIVGRSSAAVRQMASRARRRVQGKDVPEAGPGRHREIVSAFLSASRSGDFAALLSLLDPDVVLRADTAGVAMGAEAEVRGARAVARTFSGRARAARLALVDGEPGAVWAQDGTPRVVFAFTVTDGRVSEIELLADTELLGQLDLAFLDR
ncbi:MAG TPA: sigma-70 family RNA polymerase sigma factor [Blastococcus sp.]